MSTPVLTAVAWPYANGPRHIGHVSGFGVPADVFSRYQRMVGNDVLMVSGTDEHGTPILVQADAEGVSARELADRYNRVIVGDLQGLGLSYDLFTRTSTRNHYAVVQELFRAASPIEHVVLGGLSSGGSGRRHTAAAVVHYRSGFGDEGAGARPRARRGVVGGRRDRWYGTRWRIVRPTAIAAL